MTDLVNTILLAAFASIALVAIGFWMVVSTFRSEARHWREAHDELLKRHIAARDEVAELTRHNDLLRHQLRNFGDHADTEIFAKRGEET